MSSRKPGSKDRILLAAVRLFSLHGYARASLRAIAREANVSVTLITHYFQNKLGLLQAVDSRLRSMFVHAAADADRSAAASGAIALNVFTRSVVETLASQADFGRYLRRVVVTDHAANGMQSLMLLLKLARNLEHGALPSHGEPECVERSTQFLLQALGPTLLDRAFRSCLAEVPVYRERSDGTETRTVQAEPRVGYLDRPEA